MDRRETQAPEELQPQEEAALLAQQAHRRRARFRFTLAVFAGLALILHFGGFMPILLIFLADAAHP